MATAATARILGRKMHLGEVEVLKMPAGSQMVVNNTPSNVTTTLRVDDQGNVSHSQEILDTDTGKIVAALNKSRVGGFSWAAPGRDGGSAGATRLSVLAGFDFVLNPGYNANRGYVLESAGEGNDIDRDFILESVAKATGLADAKVEEMVDGWRAQSVLYASDLEERLEEAALYEAALVEKLTEREVAIMERDRTLSIKVAALDDLDQANQEAAQALKKAQDDHKALVNMIVAHSPFVIPEEAVHAMMNHDLAKAAPIFESAQRIDFRQYPIKGDGLPVPGPSGGKTAPTGWDV